MSQPIHELEPSLLKPPIEVALAYGVPGRADSPIVVVEPNRPHAATVVLIEQFDDDPYVTPAERVILVSPPIRPAMRTALAMLQLRDDPDFAEELHDLIGEADGLTAVQLPSRGDLSNAALLAINEAKRALYAEEKADGRSQLEAEADRAFLNQELGRQATKAAHRQSAGTSARHGYSSYFDGLYSKPARGRRNRINQLPL